MLLIYIYLGEEAKKLWSRLRDAFRSSCKRRDSTRSGDAATSVKPWKFHEQMSFLKSYMKDRQRHTNESNVEIEGNLFRNENDSDPSSIDGHETVEVTEDGPGIDVSKPKKHVHLRKIIQL